MSVSGSWRPYPYGGSTYDISGAWLYFPYETKLSIADLDSVNQWNYPAQEQNLAHDSSTGQVLGSPQCGFFLYGSAYDPTLNEWTDSNATIGGFRSYTTVDPDTGNKTYSCGDMSFVFNQYDDNNQSILVRGQLRLVFQSASGSNTIYMPKVQNSADWVDSIAYYTTQTLALGFDYEISETKTDGTPNIYPFVINGEDMPYNYGFMGDDSVYTSHPYETLNAFKFDQDFPYTWDFNDDDYLGDRLYIKTPQGFKRVGEYLKTEQGLRKLYSKTKNKHWGETVNVGD